LEEEYYQALAENIAKELLRQPKPKHKDAPVPVQRISRTASREGSRGSLTRISKVRNDLKFLMVSI